MVAREVVGLEETEHAPACPATDRSAVGESLIAELEAPFARHEFEDCMRIVISVWQAVTLDKVEGSERWTTSLYEHAGEGRPN